jgi:penicillin amidase
VDIYRDEFGIPQIYAGSAHDLFFAEGYVHAQDRFWQMDFWRHLGAGKLSELLGEDTVGTDKFLRTLGWERIAMQEYEDSLPADRANMQAYADGVNAYLADHKGSALSFEYLILKAINANYQVEPWQPYHALTWAKVMAWDLRGNMDDEISRAVLSKTLTDEQIGDIIPPYDSSRPVILPGFRVPGSVGHRGTGGSNLLQALSPLFESLSEQVGALDAYLGVKGEGIGSNNWVISGERTVHLV